MLALNSRSCFSLRIGQVARLTNTQMKTIADLKNELDLANKKLDAAKESGNATEITAAWKKANQAYIAFHVANDGK